MPNVYGKYVPLTKSSFPLMIFFRITNNYLPTYFKSVDYLEPCCFLYIIIAPKRQPCTAAVGHWLHWTCKMFWMKRSLLSAFFALLCFRAAVGFFCPNSSEFRPSFKSRRQLSYVAAVDSTRGLYFWGRCLRDIWVDIYLLKFQGKNVYVRDFLNAVKAGFAAWSSSPHLTFCFVNA